MNNIYECITSFQYGIEVGDRKELVRCKDCNKRGTYGCPVYVGGDGMCSEPDDWFCADGERKSD